jgi:glycosyltransferase involved in cell wall biosynthesis
MSLVTTPYVAAVRTDRHVAPWKHRLVRATDRVLSRHATTHFHAITQAVQAHYISAFGLREHDVTVVPRGRDRHRLGERTAARRSHVRASLDISARDQFLLAVGRQEAAKGHRYLLEATAQLSQRMPHIVVLIAGREGELTPRLRQTVARLQLDGRVRFLGYRDDVADLMCAADALVFPSLYEGLGGTLLEAMALGLPIVSSDTPGTSEVLDAGRCGWLAPPGNASALAARIEDALTDHDRTLAKVAAGQERFDAVYSSAVVAERMVELYQSLVRS